MPVSEMCDDVFPGVLLRVELYLYIERVIWIGKL
jgi:hypothetical protein